MSVTDGAPADLITAVLGIARAAAQEIMRVYHTDFDVTQKADLSPVTAADLAAHGVIAAGLALLTPGWPLLSEEAANIPYAERAVWQRYWLVDPLDGTREFTQRNGDFTVNIALVERGKPVLGVVCAPVSGDCYFATFGGGAYKIAGQAANGQMPERIRVREWSGTGCVVVGSRSHAGASLAAFLAHLGDYQMLSMGSSLKLCLVAEGRADIYPRLGLTSEWDTAAAQCVVEEAGGRVTDCTLRTLRYNSKESLLNPHFLVFGDTRYDWSRFL